MKRASNNGNILSLLAVREIREDCLILRPAQNAKWSQEYQAVVKVDPVNFPLMIEGEQDRIIAGFRAYLLSQAPQDRTTLVHMRIREYDLAPYTQRLRETVATHPHKEYREMAQQHLDYLTRLGKTQSLRTREFYVLVNVLINLKARPYKYLSEAELFEQAHTEIINKALVVMSGLGRAGLSSTLLQGERLAQYQLSRIQQDDAETYGISPELLATLDTPPQAMALFHSPLFFSSEQAGEEKAQQASEQREGVGSVSTRRWVWPPMRTLRHQQRSNHVLDSVPDLVSLPELLQPASVERTPHYVRVHHHTDEYIRGRAVIGYPAYVTPGWVDEVLSIDEPNIDILLFFETLDPRRYIQSLSRKLTSYNATQILETRQGKTENPYIAAARSDTEEYRHKLVAKTEHIHAVSLYALSRAADKHTLFERDKKVAQVLKEVGLQTVALEYEHLQAWLSVVNARDVLHRVRKLDTSTLACAMPFCSSNISTETGALIGLTPSGGMVLIDPTSEQLENGHELVFAQSGSGKSFYEKVGLMRHLLRGMEGIVIDPDNEFARICDQYRGTSIHLVPGNFQINPFDLGPVVEERNALTEKLDSLLVLFDLLLAERDPGVLPQREKSYLHTMLLRAYTAREITADPATHGSLAPTLQEVYDLIVEEGDTYHLADRLVRHLTLFPERTTVQLDNQLVVFNLKDLKDLSEELLRIAVYVIAEFVWATVRKERVPRPRLLLIDEAWMLAEFLEGGKFLEKLSKTARKYNLHLRMVTQNVEDFLASKSGRTILVNSAMTMLMHHDATSLDLITRAFKLSEEERRFLETAPKGQGLFFCRNSHVPLWVVASELEYQLANTDPNELLFLEQASIEREAEEEAQKQQDIVESEKGRDSVQILIPRVFVPTRQQWGDAAAGEDDDEQEAW